MSDSPYEVIGHFGAWILVRSGTQEIVGCFYAKDGEPGWYRGHTRGVVKEVFLPGDVDPVDVARRFLD
ncbi:hypothetical protein [Spirillospora sp. CA-128828]|uniref:hypothetical protein n=1 Tax=Spirillospora sp. CA-128828 TaxID=3240033 RepID=UPI003D93801D